MSAQLYLRIPSCVPVPQVAAFVARCEEAGFTGVGITDTQLLAREVFVTMALAAEATSRIQVASAVVNPVTRHASVIASAAKTLEEATPGRVQIWVGRGLTAVGTIGLPMASLQQTKETIVTLRKLLAGEAVTFNGTTSRLRHGGGGRVPVYLTATGPKMLALAGEVADGVVARVGIHPQAVAEARRHVDEGARRANRDPSEVELVACATTVIHEELQAARELARPIGVYWLMEPGHARWLRAAGVDTESLKLPPELWELYPDVAHAVDRERAQRLCSFLPDDVLAQICDTLGLIGTPHHCAQRLRETVEAGLDRLYLMPDSTYELPQRELEAFRQVVFPALASPR